MRQSETTGAEMTKGNPLTGCPFVLLHSFCRWSGAHPGGYPLRSGCDRATRFRR